MVHYNEVGIETYYGQKYFNCHSGTTYEVPAFNLHFHLSKCNQASFLKKSFKCFISEHDCNVK